MAANPIYIETEEEIPEVIERVRRTSAEDVPLVLPTRSRFGQSRFNFQLLREYTSQMGKRVSIVSPDPAVQQMAEESGFRAFRAVEQLGVNGGDAEGPAAVAVLPPPRPLPAAGAAGAKAAPRIAVAPRTRLPSRVATEVKPGRFLLYAGAGILLVVGIVLAALYVPAASVTLTVDAVAFKQDNLEVDAQPGSGPVHVRTQTDAQQATQGFKATGVKDIPGTVANGTVVYHNGCSNLIITVPDGLRVSGGGQTFATKGQVGPLQPGQAGSASVVAVNPGAAGNVPAGTINTINNNNTSCLTVTQPSDTSGGADEQKKTVIQTSDIETARSSLDAQLRKQIGDDLGKQVQNGEKLSDQIAYQPADFAPDHKVGDEVGNFNATMKLTGEGAYYNAADVEKAFDALLTRKVPADKQLTDNPIKTNYTIANAAEGGHLTFKGSASAFLAPKIDFDRVKGRLVGRTLGSAQHDLSQLPVQSAQIKETPFKLPLMPLQSSRITIQYVVQQAPASTPPTPG
ncbi:MAG TPA: baseplate J/gp47 family protein [Candidatus Dormibacteraeota bacterium]